MRSLIIGAVLLISVPVNAQEPADTETLLDGLNEAIGAGEEPRTLPGDQGERTPVVPMPSEPDDSAQVSPANRASSVRPAIADLPNWGVVVRDETGAIRDVFGQVQYQVTNTGAVNVPGYEPPPGSRLEVVPQTEYMAAMETVSADELDWMFKPITDIPGVVILATDYLAQELCAKKGRPTGMTLSLAVNASGTIWFASAGTEAGSAVSWDFQDVCGRYGLEGEGIAFK